ncbi:MAG TPA: hypothetical protein VF598_06115 [Hymenobacter sp.]
MTSSRTIIKSAGAVSALTLGLIAFGTSSASAVNNVGQDPVNGGFSAVSQKCDLDRNPATPSELDGFNTIPVSGKVVGYAFRCDTLDSEEFTVDRTVVVLPSADAAKAKHNVSVKMTYVDSGKTVVAVNGARYSGTLTARAFNTPYGAPIKVTIVQEVPGTAPDAVRTFVLGDDED